MAHTEPKIYTGKKGFERHRVEHFGIQRKIVANMTTESWDNIPHASLLYEPDVTDFWDAWMRLRKQPGWEGITINTVLLAIITQGLIACPAMNAHLEFKRRTVNGKLEEYKDVNISMPMMLPGGEGMMTINIHNCERKNLRQLDDYIRDVRRRMEKTNLTEAMFEVSMDNTFRLLRRGKFHTIVGRLWGAKVGKGKVSLLRGADKKAYYAIPKGDRLTKADIEQGTIVVSNIGSVYRGNYTAAALLEIIPPHVAALCIGSVAEKPGVVTDAAGEKSVAPRKFLPITLAMDHRALDFGDVTPFLLRLDDIYARPEQIADWL